MLGKLPNGEVTKQNKNQAVMNCIKEGASLGADPLGIIENIIQILTTDGLWWYDESKKKEYK